MAGWMGMGLPVRFAQLREVSSSILSTENNRAAKRLIFNMFQPPSPLLSSSGDNNDKGLSAAPGLV
jgi:hypothetical protein